MTDAAPDVAQLHGFRGRDPRTDELWRRMEAWEELLAKQAGTLADAVAGIAELRRQLSAQSEQAPAVAPADDGAVLSQVDDRFRALQRALQPVLDGLGERVGQLETAPAPAGRLSPAEAGTLRRVDEGLGDVRRILGEHGARIDRRASDIQTLATAIRKLSEHVGYKGNLSGN